MVKRKSSNKRFNISTVLRNYAPTYNRKTGKPLRKSAACPFLENPIIRKLLLGVLESSLELIHASACINKLLLTGKEGMALGADINFQVAALGGLGFHNFATSASDRANFVIRMDSVFHFHVPLFKYLMFFDIGEPRPARQTVVLYHKEKKFAIVF